MTETQEQIISWFAHQYTGVSSETMAFWLGFGIKKRSFSHPHDPDDLDRCIKLLIAAPGLRDHLGDMAALSSAWRKLVGRWDEIEQSFLDEAGLGWCKARSAPKTYQLMKEILDGEF
jgi:hypothetical protein